MNATLILRGGVRKNVHNTCQDCKKRKDLDSFTFGWRQIE